MRSNVLLPTPLVPIRPACRPGATRKDTRVEQQIATRVGVGEVGDGDVTHGGHSEGWIVRCLDRARTGLTTREAARAAAPGRVVGVDVS